MWKLKELQLFGLKLIIPSNISDNLKTSYIDQYMILWIVHDLKLSKLWNLLLSECFIYDYCSKIDKVALEIFKHEMERLTYHY